MSAAVLDDEPTPSAASERQREFDYRDEDFQRIRAMIHRYAGIALSASKRDMAYSRLARCLRSARLSSFRAYLDLVESGDEAEREKFTNALTTNLTAFFREDHHFPILADFLRRTYDGKPLTIWCSAASTGEEPYSIAMTAIEAFESERPPVRVLASDIATHVLKRAEAGVYPIERVESLAAERLKRFFQRGSGEREGMVRVRSEVRQLVAFRQINLLDPQWPVRPPLDAIFCRNVMIYFDKPTQAKILERFRPLLRQDGLLFAGHSENFQGAVRLFRPLGKTVYRPAPQGIGQ